MCVIIYHFLTAMSKQKFFFLIIFSNCMYTHLRILTLFTKHVHWTGEKNEKKFKAYFVAVI